MFRNFSSLYGLLVFTLIIIAPNFTEAKRKKFEILSPIQTSLVVDIKTGKILHNENGHTKIHPASTTKLMTLYLLFEAIEAGKLSLNSRLYVSKNAEKMPPCKLNIRAGDTISVREAILGLIVKSANDVAVAVGENLAGSHIKFALLMNQRARQLGMKNTHFKNSSGWHHADQKTTAVDLAKLAIALRRDHSKFYSLFSRTSFEYRGNIIRGHNPVTANYVGAEGLKTGYTRPSGFNLVTTASKNGKSLVGVVTGSQSAGSRDKKMIALLEKHFKSISTLPNNAPTALKKTIKLASGQK